MQAPGSAFARALSQSLEPGPCGSRWANPPHMGQGSQIVIPRRPGQALARDRRLPARRDITALPLQLDFPSAWFLFGGCLLVRYGP